MILQFVLSQMIQPLPDVSASIFCTCFYSTSHPHFPPSIWCQFFLGGSRHATTRRCKAHLRVACFHGLKEEVSLLETDTERKRSSQLQRGGKRRVTFSAFIVGVHKAFIGFGWKLCSQSERHMAALPSCTSSRRAKRSGRRFPTSQEFLLSERY